MQLDNERFIWAINEMKILQLKIFFALTNNKLQWKLSCLIDVNLFLKLIDVFLIPSMRVNDRFDLFSMLFFISANN